MVFNSLEGLLFILLSLGLYHAIPARWWRGRKLFLVGASYCFYMSWSPAYGVLLAGCTVAVFLLGLALDRASDRRSRRTIVTLGVSLSLGVLGWFKYGEFLRDSVVRAFGWPLPPPLDVLLPIGISFYTFESLSYLVDVYRGERASRKPLDFALFLSFYPHLVAGPIVRPHDFLPQLRASPALTAPAIELAFARIAQGMLKKVLVADTLALYVDAVWREPDLWPAGNVVLAMYAYAFQIYFDFSGYTDIALGLAQLFGLWLPENFDRPYLARNPREFWQRWHISLSTWLRDYLYVPLGGNRGSRVATYRNLLLTMLLGGLWHGAAWGFVAWGAYHGVLLAVHRALGGGRSAAAGGARAWLARAGTFHLVCLGWVLFRAPTMDALWAMAEGLGRPGMIWVRDGTAAAVLVALAAAMHAAPSAPWLRARFVALPPWVQGLAYAATTAAIFLFAPASAPFIYFQF
jgi:D-alanyl-lipoteichoic acid acyltransferase DltB (MBOAT superfamily)